MRISIRFAFKCECELSRYQSWSTHSKTYLYRLALLHPTAHCLENLPNMQTKYEFLYGGGTLWSIVPLVFPSLDTCLPCPAYKIQSKNQSDTWLHTFPLPTERETAETSHEQFDMNNNICEGYPWMYLHAPFDIISRFTCLVFIYKVLNNLPWLIKFWKVIKSIQNARANPLHDVGKRFQVGRRTKIFIHCTPQECMSDLHECPTGRKITFSSLWFASMW